MTASASANQVAARIGLAPLAAIGLAGPGLMNMLSSPPPWPASPGGPRRRLGAGVGGEQQQIGPTRKGIVFGLIKPWPFPAGAARHAPAIGVGDDDTARSRRKSGEAQIGQARAGPEAPAGQVLQGGVAPVGAGDRPDHRQPQAGPAGLARAGRLAAVEGLEHLVAVDQRHAWPVVVDLDHGGGVLA